VITPYDTDVYAWSQEQAALLNGQQWKALDIANLIEEILSVGESQYTAVSSAVYQILVHLLKWRYQPGRQSRSWRVSLIEHRSRIPRRLRHAPSLAHEIPRMIAEEYPAACRKASAQTGLPCATFPATCPWTPEQLLDVDFWPQEPTTPA
jgi:hypothetical protein